MPGQVGPDGGGNAYANGTINTVGKFISSDTLGDSAISESGGNVGIGGSDFTVPFLADNPSLATFVDGIINPTIMSVGNAASSDFGAFAMIAPRGTLAAPADNQDGDSVGQVQFYGLYESGTVTADTAYIESTVVSAASKTGNLIFRTAGSGGVPVIALVLAPTGVATFINAVKLTPVAFASLPATPEEGMIASVNNSNTATWGATIAAGGSNKVLAYYNGVNWTVAGK